MAKPWLHGANPFRQINIASCLHLVSMCTGLCLKKYKNLNKILEKVTFISVCIAQYQNLLNYIKYTKQDHKTIQNTFLFRVLQKQDYQTVQDLIIILSNIRYSWKCKRSNTKIMRLICIFLFTWYVQLLVVAFKVGPHWVHSFFIHSFHYSKDFCILLSGCGGAPPFCMYLFHHWKMGILHHLDFRE